jgi:hypothetical protein
MEQYKLKFSKEDQIGGSIKIEEKEKIPQYEIVTIEDFKKTAGISKSENRLKFEQKIEDQINVEDISEELLDKIKNEEDVSKWTDVKIYQDKIIIADSTEHSLIAIRNLELDEYGGNHGISNKVAVYLINRDNNKIVNNDSKFVTYRDGKNRDNDKWDINYDEAKIINEDDSKIIVGLKSRESLIIKSFDKNTGAEIELEKNNIENEEKEQKKLDSVTKAFEELDKDVILEVVDSMYERSVIRKFKQVSDSLAVIGVSDYGKKDMQQVEMLLAIKNMGIVKLDKIQFQEKSGIARDDFTFFELGNSNVEYLEKSFLVKGKIKKRLDHFNGLGSTMRDIEEKLFQFEISNELDKTAPIKRDLENLKSKVLSPGNFNKISIMKLNFRDSNAENMLSNYPYDIQKITRSDGKELLLVSKVIDIEHLNGIYSAGVMAIEPQINFSVYEIDNLGSGNPTLIEKESMTTDTNDRKDTMSALPVQYDKETGEVSFKKPEISIEGDNVLVTIDIAVPSKENENRLDIVKRTFKIKI